MQSSPNWYGECMPPKYQQLEEQYANPTMQSGQNTPTKPAKYELDGIERQLLADVVTTLGNIKTPFDLDAFLSRRAVVTALQLLVRIAKTEGVTK